MDLEKINRELEHVDHNLDQKLDHSNVINSNNIIIEENPEAEKRRGSLNIVLTILVAILIIVILLFIGSFINGDKLLNT